MGIVRHGGLDSEPHGGVRPVCRDPEADTPTKVWPLHARCTLSPLEHHQFTARGRHSNIVVAFATRHVHKKELVCAPI